MGKDEKARERRRPMAGVRGQEMRQRHEGERGGARYLRKEEMKDG